MGNALATSIYVLAATTSYVAVLHLFHPPDGNRDEHVVVQSRLRRALTVTVINVVLAAFMTRYVFRLSDSIGEALGYFGLGIHWSTIIDVVRTILLFAGLFTGPIIERIIDDYKEMNRIQMLRRYGRDEIHARRQYKSENGTDEGNSSHNSPTDASEKELMIRDYLVAPGTEEIIYTGIAAGIYRPFFVDSPGMKESVTIFTPLLFGTAHLHHAFELCKEGYPTSAIVFTVTFQLLYTTLFGILTNLVFFNSGSICCCIAAHSFCNFMGVPSLKPRTESVVYKLAYWFLLAFGIWFFRTRFNSLTVPILSD